ncbi:MAG: hypothetical protein ACRCW1_03695 [Anaerotignaceae bacterium]
MESNYAYYCLHKLKMLPSQFLNLGKEERAFIIAAIEIKIEYEKKEAAKMKKKR